MAHELAGQVGGTISPWDALEGEVRRTSYRVAMLDVELATAMTAEELVGRGRLAAIERLQFRERTHLARVSKMAIDAGIAARLVAQIAEDGQAIAGVLVGTLTELGLPEEDLDRARSILRRRLLALDSGTIEGEWNDGSGTQGIQGTSP